MLSNLLSFYCKILYLKDGLRNKVSIIERMKSFRGLDRIMIWATTRGRERNVRLIQYDNIKKYERPCIRHFIHDTTINLIY